MSDSFYLGNEGAFAGPAGTEMGFVCVLYAAIKSGGDGVGASFGDLWAVPVDHGSALPEYLHAGHDVPRDDLRPDSDGREPEKTFVDRERAVSPCALPDDLHDLISFV